MHSHQRKFRENFVMPESRLPKFNPMALGGRDADEGPAPKGTILGGRDATQNLPMFIRNFKKMFTYRISTGAMSGIVLVIAIVCILLFLWAKKIGPFASKKNIVLSGTIDTNYVFF